MLFDKATPEQEKVQKTCIDRVVNGLLAQINKLPERLFLTGSAELERSWLVYGMGDFYPQLAARQRETRPLDPQLLRLYRRRLNKVQALIDSYSARGFHNEGATIDQPRNNRASLNDGAGSTDDDEEIQVEVDPQAPLYRQVLAEFSSPVVGAGDILLPPFRSEPAPRNLPAAELPPDQQAFDHYLSTPLFVKRLC